MVLFASHLNHQLPSWLWWNGHPMAAAFDALSLTGHDCPSTPFPLLENALMRFSKDYADKVIIIAPIG